MEQAQTKLSKYAAKQQRLANDPGFGIDYQLTEQVERQVEQAIKAKTEQRLAREAADPERQARLDKIIKMQIEIRTLERRIESAKAHIVKLTASIERQKELLLHHV